ncbi:MAG: DUF3347 domain-containing protein [Puia sp.]
MKMFFVLITIVSSFSANAGLPSFNQSVVSINDTTTESSLPQLLSLYYDIKDALVGSDAANASVKAASLLNAINGMDIKTLTKTEQAAFTPLQAKLAYDARHISEVKDISHQREHFANLSLNMYTLAKNAKLSDQPVYKDYCPMKKAYWLSSAQTIKNPYYGNAMLTCGKVDETLK